MHQHTWRLVADVVLSLVDCDGCREKLMIYHCPCGLQSSSTGVFPVATPITSRALLMAYSAEEQQAGTPLALAARRVQQQRIPDRRTL